ncbi:hypothetical protein GCM10025879_18870 [Leuconostoc litchii]|uniref:Uncharacterized protein n=1 Tax=Leuconostoc litchii TaxID=1981069 RepID=A0A6P2CL29_9LACO|nr:hypothetical protein [Leuconostoc litchii]TYC46758.1 hypothetical protein ESZ47_01055 [Leuconostoc litchii]GMA70641.1 hypothetical protein GCM10025879_18870 [Leuconostoc litchii]
MGQERLDFLVFYRGNLVEGFDYVYVKRQDGRAFWKSEYKAQEAKDILDKDFMFYNPHLNDKGEPFNWRYREDWVDMTKVWDHFSEESIAYIKTWLDEYRGPAHDDPSKNDEWGVRWKEPNNQEKLIWGLNAFPANLNDFSDFLYRFGK